MRNIRKKPEDYESFHRIKTIYHELTKKSNTNVWRESHFCLDDHEDLVLDLVRYVIRTKKDLMHFLNWQLNKSK